MAREHAHLHGVHAGSQRGGKRPRLQSEGPVSNIDQRLTTMHSRDLRDRLEELVDVGLTLFTHGRKASPQGYQKNGVRSQAALSAHSTVCARKQHFPYTLFIRDLAAGVTCVCFCLLCCLYMHTL